MGAIRCPALLCFGGGVAWPIEWSPGKPVITASSGLLGVAGTSLGSAAPGKAAAALAAGTGLIEAGKRWLRVPVPEAACAMLSARWPASRAPTPAAPIFSGEPPECSKGTSWTRRLGAMENSVWDSASSRAPVTPRP